MNQRQAFLQTIIEAPEDDTPRLVFADWLDDEGDAKRAEFIRTQIALERLPAADARRPELARREKELLNTHGWGWAEEVGCVIEEWQFRRGFIERAQMSLLQTGDEIAAILNLAPIRHIRDTTQADTLAGVVEALPHLGRLTGLEYWGLYYFDNDDL